MNCASTVDLSRPPVHSSLSLRANAPGRMTRSKPLPPRTRAESLRDVDYIVRLGVVHQRLFSRLDKGLKLIQAFAGSAAVSGQPVTVAIVGAVVALAASVSLVFDFGQAAHAYGVLVSRCTAHYCASVEQSKHDHC